MLTIEVRNVNEALSVGLMHMSSNIAKEISPRGIPTLEYPTPVATTYRYPKERVLFRPSRDANPFFHMMEALWIIGGRRDVNWLAQFNSQMREYSDNGEIFHGAYGYRLRTHQGFDQLKRVIELLKNDPDTRQAVLQIWDAKSDLGARSKDIPCNDVVFLKIREGRLNIRVCCRSNDMIWGAYGANAVQFSMLQEYIAGMVGVEVGTYTQISDSFHIYPDNPKWKAMLKEDSWYGTDYYDSEVMIPYPIMDNPESWDTDLNIFMEYTSGIHVHPNFTNDFFSYVALPIYLAWKSRKEGDLDGCLNCISNIEARDWRLVCTQWVERRMK